MQQTRNMRQACLPTWCEVTILWPKVQTPSGLVLNLSHQNRAEGLILAPFHLVVSVYYAQNTALSFGEKTAQNGGVVVEPEALQ